MADIIDNAQDRSEIELQRALNARKVYTGKSSLYCCDCGEPIPQQRREAVPGCSYCIDCQQIADLKGRV